MIELPAPARLFLLRDAGSAALFSVERAAFFFLNLWVTLIILIEEEGGTTHAKI